MELIKEYTKNRKYGKYVKLDGKTYSVEVRYAIGGMNWFTNRTEARGIYLSVSPIELMFDGRGNIVMTSYRGWSGTKMLVLEQTRYNAKKLEQIATGILDRVETHELVQQLFSDVLAKNRQLKTITT